MDKYEYKLRAEEIIRLAGKKNYPAAAKLADDIRWEKVRNIQMLCTVSEIYEKIGKYDESKDVLLLAYNRSPNSKNIVYRLTELSIAMEDYEEATDFYHEYVQLAPRDNNVLILKYKLYKGRGAKLETLISILEEFKSRDYQEEWILELARLYHQAGDRERCVEICNEIDLWFNTGKSVIQALELKKLYEPLTPLQEKKLQNRAEYIAEDVEESEQEDEDTLSPQIRERLRAVEQAHQKPEEKHIEPEEPKPETNREDPVAAAIIKMAREKRKTSELEKDFSILPKKNVVKSDSEQFSFELPEGAGDVDLLDMERKPVEQEGAEEPDKTVDEKEAAGKPDLLESLLEEEPSEPLQEETVLEEEEQDITFLAGQDEESGQDAEDQDDERPKGLLGKMFSKLTMEDDELDEDFNDDYIDDEFEEQEKEDPMVTRGLTGQYEKVVIEEDDDDDDPLNARLTGQFEAVEEEEELEEEEEAEAYEYAYADEDDAEEYDEIDEEGMEEDEDEIQPTRGNKRFNFFRNTMEDDEMFEDDDDAYEDEASEETQEPYTENAGEAVIPLSYAEKYDTLNLQKELAKSIQQLMDATEKETVDSTLENVKKMVEESHIPELTETMRFKAIRGNMLNSVAKNQARKLQEAKDIEEVIYDRALNRLYEEPVTADATVKQVESRPKPAVELAIKLKPSEEDEKIPIDQMLTQEDDGQLSLFVPASEQEEEQVAGQMSIEDVLKEWEKQELLSENDKEKRALEEARKNALEETQGIMVEIMGLLKDVIPKISSIKDGEKKMSDLAESLEKVQKSLPLSQGIVEAAENSKVAASAIEAACAEAVEELERMEQENSTESEQPGESELQSWQPEESELQPEQEQPEKVKLQSEQPKEPIEQLQNAEEHMFDNKEETIHSEEPSGLGEIMPDEDTPMPDLETAFRDMEQSLKMEEGEKPTDEEAYLKEQMALHELFTEAEPGSADLAMPEEVSEELMPELEQNGAMVQEEETSPELENAELDDEQKNVLAYFMSIGSLAKVLPAIVKKTEYAPEHMIITGAEGSGRTSIAMRIIKAAQLNKEDKVETIAKIKASLLNQKEITDILGKVNGGVLIIEKAGSLKPSTVYALEEALYSNRYYVQIILVDKASAIDRLLMGTNSFLNDIQMRVDLPVYTNNELAEFAKTYADVNGYVLDGMAVLALHSVIDIFQTDKHAANLEDVKNIMDEAMERADKRSNKFFGKLFGKKHTDYTTLIESDFE